MHILRIFSILIFVLALTCCRKPYQPDIASIDGNYLVVEGFINTGADSTFIKLSRTVVIQDKNGSKPEFGAAVTVESDKDESYRLIEGVNGNYFRAPLNLNNNNKYRLRIVTAKGNTYLSDFVEAKVSPAIDSISYKVQNNGVQVYSNTHDDNAKSIYYRWEYAETWQFTALYYSEVIANGVSIVPRDQITDNIYTCWASNNFSPIVLGSSEKLNKDVIYQNPLVHLPIGSEKISVKYSILVKQYVLTKEAFNFWESLKKNTESLGSIFDAQPSQLTGNVHNVDDPSEPVIGFISAGTIQQQRVFIAKEKLPDWRTIYPYDCGPLDSVYTVHPITLRREEDLYFQTHKLIPISGFGAGHLGATIECADCTIRGTNKKPAFWQ